MPHKPMKTDLIIGSFLIAISFIENLIKVLFSHISALISSDQTYLNSDIYPNSDLVKKNDPKFDLVNIMTMKKNISC